MFGLLLALLIGAALLAVLTWSDISSWITTNATGVSKYGEIIKEKLATGNYQVVVGVFDKRNTRTAKTSWTAKELDADLNARFRSANRIVVDV